MILNSSVNRHNNDDPHENKTLFLDIGFTYRVNHAMIFIARCCFIFAVLQFVVITRYYASLRFAKKKQQRTLNTIQLRNLG